MSPLAATSIVGAVGKVTGDENVSESCAQVLFYMTRRLCTPEAFRFALVDIVLHVREQVGIRTIEKRNASKRDFPVHGSKATEDNVVIHH
jgi:hypothetical protein